MDLTLKKRTIVLFFACGLLTLAGCKKENEATKEPEGEPTLEGVWNVTSWKVTPNGTVTANEQFGIWHEFLWKNLSCTQQAGDTINCNSKRKLSSMKLVLQKDETYYWTGVYEYLYLDEIKSSNNCSCVYKPLVQDEWGGFDIEGTWILSPNKKLLTLKPTNGSIESENYSIISLTKNSMQITIKHGSSHSEEYWFVK